MTLCASSRSSARLASGSREPSPKRGRAKTRAPMTENGGAMGKANKAATGSETSYEVTWLDEGGKVRQRKVFNGPREWMEESVRTLSEHPTYGQLYEVGDITIDDDAYEAVESVGMEAMMSEGNCEDAVNVCAYEAYQLLHGPTPMTEMEPEKMDELMTAARSYVKSNCRSVGIEWEEF